MSKRSGVYLAVPVTEGRSATQDIKEQIRDASRIADRRGLRRVVTCLSLAMHILEEEEKDRSGSRA